MLWVTPSGKIKIMGPNGEKVNMKGKFRLMGGSNMQGLVRTPLFIHIM